MKKFWLLTCLFVLFAEGGWGDNYIWTNGSGDEDWTNSSNWRNETTGFDPALNYPGQISNIDIVTIGDASVTIFYFVNLFNLASITIAELNVIGGSGLGVFPTVNSFIITGDVLISGSFTSEETASGLHTYGFGGNSTTIEVGGNWDSSNGQYTSGSGGSGSTDTITFTGSGTINVNPNDQFHNVIIDGNYSLESDLKADNVNITNNGTLDPNGNQVIGEVIGAGFGASYTWTGDVNNDWNNSGNWDVGIYPDPTDNTSEIIIPGAYTNPLILNVNVSCDTISIANPAVVDLAGFTLTAADSITNNGTIKLHGIANQVTEAGVAPAAGTNSTIHYYNAAGNSWVFGDTYNNLTVEDKTAMANIASLTVNGTASIGADITTTTGGQTYTGNVTLTNDVNFTGNAGALVQFSGNVTGAALARNLTITTANVQFDGAVNDNIASVNVTAGTSAINANITTIGTQNYGGAVTLGGGALNAVRTLQGTTVIFNAITGNTRSLTVTGNAEFNGAVNGIVNLNVSGTSAINTDITTTGTQTYTGAVTLGGAAGVRTLTGTTVSLGNITNGNNHALTVDGNAALNGSSAGSNVGALQVNGNAVFAAAPFNSASVNVAGNSTINADIITSGNQTYGTGAANTVALGAVQRTLTSTGGSITANGIVSGTAGVILNASQRITMTPAAGNNTLSGNVQLNNNQGTSANGVSFSSTGAITISGVNLSAAGTNPGNFSISSGNMTVDGSGINAGTINLTSSGTIIQNAASGAITTTGTLTLNSGGAITLNNAANSVATLNVTGAGGAVQFTDSRALVIAGVNNVGANNVNITTTGAVSDITQSGVIATTGILAVNGGGAITLNSTSSAGAVSLTTPGILTITGTTGAISSSGNVSEGTASAVYINVDSFTGAGNINLTGTGAVCANINSEVTYSGVVTGNRIHYHTTTAGRHIVYRTGAPVLTGFSDVGGTTDTIPANTYLYIQADANLGNNLNFATTGAGNIYIIDVGNAANANARTVTFTAGGYIEIRGAYRSTGTLTLTTSQPVRFVNSEANNNNPTVLTLPSFTLPTGIELNLRGDGVTASITTTGAAGITLRTINGNVPANAGTYHLTLTSGGTGNPINITGAIGAATRLGNITVTDCAVNFTGAITAASYTQSNGSAVLNALQNYTGAFSFTGTTLTFGNTLNTGGSVTINNTGAFTQNTGAVITSADAFTQTGAGNNILNANITANGGEISFAGPVTSNVITASANGNISFAGVVTLTGTTTLNSSAGNGNILFTSAATPAITGSAANAGNLTMTAGTGNVSIAGQVGTNASRIGNINVTNAGYVSIARDVFAQNIYFGSPYLEITNNVMLSIPNAGGIIKLSSNVLCGTNRLTLSGGSAANKMELGRYNNGPVSIDGNVTIAANSNVVIDDDTELTHITQVTQTDGKELTLENNAVLDTSTSSWHIGTVGTSNDFAGISGTLILEGKASLLNADGTYDYNDISKLIANNLNLTGASFSIENTGWTIISAKDDVNIADTPSFTGDLPQLIIEMNGSGRQYLTADQDIGSLHVKSGSITTLTNDLTVTGEVQITYNGVLDADENDITLKAGLTETKGSSIAKIGRWEIIGVPNYDPIVSPPPYNMSTTAFRQSLDNKVVLTGNNGAFFEIIGNTVWQKLECNVPGAQIEFSRDPHQHVFLYELNIDNKIPSGSSPSPADPDNIVLTRYIGYRQPPPVPTWVNKYGIGSAVFIPSDNGEGLPRYPPSPNLKGEPPAEKEKFWNINLMPLNPGLKDGHTIMQLNNVTVYFSHAWYQRIPVPEPISGNKIIHAIPFYEPGKESFFCYDWIRVKKIIYSFVEDSNGNGKVDRIRVQTTLALNGNFDYYQAEIEGYEQDTTKGDRGFNVVSHITRDPNDNASFYIYLKEKSYLYDGQPITWRVTLNDDSLMDLLSETQLIGGEDVNEVYRTINTIPPRVSYSLSLPGHDEVYARMSQPVTVYENEDNSISINYERGNTDTTHQNSAIELELRPYYQHALQFIPRANVENEGELINRYKNASDIVSGYLFKLDSTLTISELANLPQIGNGTLPSSYFELGEIRDLGVRAMDWRDFNVAGGEYIFYPSPRYPIDWSYSKYEDFIGNGHLTDFSDDSNPGNPDPATEIFLPPNRVLTPDMIKDLMEGNGASVTPNRVNNAANSGARRITDVLVSIPPSNNNRDNYFAWPVWARYEDPANPEINTSLNLDFGFFGQLDTDDGIIWEFNGTKYLQERSILLQARVNDSIRSRVGSLSLLFNTFVPPEMRNPQEAAERGRSTGGLWLPGFSNPLFNIVPTGYVNSIYGFLAPYRDRPPYNISNPLFTFKLEAQIDFASGQKLEFLLKPQGTAASDLYIARLDIPPGAEIPDEWWKLVRPFSFDIEDIRAQRGGVTILNNVINASDREIAYIRYHLVRSGRVTIQVYTLDGTLVYSIRRNEFREAGEYTDPWNGTNNAGNPVARGMYFVRIVAPDIDEIRQIMVIR